MTLPWLNGAIQHPSDLCSRMSHSLPDGAMPLSGWDPKSPSLSTGLPKETDMGLAYHN